jgi:hypothetical protein
MRVHANQINPNAQLNALYDLQKAAAKKETDRVRKKLLNSASEIEADSDSYVAKMGSRQESQEEPENQAGAEEGDDSISDWA